MTIFNCQLYPDLASSFPLGISIKTVRSIQQPDREIAGIKQQIKRFAGRLKMSLLIENLVY